MCWFCLPPKTIVSNIIPLATRTLNPLCSLIFLHSSAVLPHPSIGQLTRPLSFLSWPGPGPGRDPQVPGNLRLLPGSGHRERRQAHPLWGGDPPACRAVCGGSQGSATGPPLPGRPETEAGEHRWRDRERQPRGRRRRGGCGGAVGLKRKTNLSDLIPLGIV